MYSSENGGAFVLLLNDTTLTSTVFTGVHGWTYRFFSIATDNVGFSEPYSEATEATTVLAPAVPVLLTPPTVTQDQAPTISWQAAAAAVSYDVWISNLSTNVSPALRLTVAATSLTPGTPLGIGRYRVWVRSLDAAGNASSWSVPKTFRINTPVAVHPLQRFQATARPTISWDALPGTVRYEVWLNNLNNNQGPYLRQSDISSTSWTSPADLPLGRYRIWLRGIDSGGVAAAWSMFREFVVLTPTVALPPRTYRVWARAVSTSGELAPWSVVKDFQITEVTQFTPDSLRHRFGTNGMDEPVPVILLSELSPEAEAHETSAAQRLKSRVSKPAPTKPQETETWTQESGLSESPQIVVRRTLSGVFHPVPDSRDQSTSPFHVTIDHAELDDAWSLDPEMLFLDQRTTVQ